VIANLVPQSIITLNDPHDFHGTICFIVPPSIDAPVGEYVDLVGLANADSFSVKNDIVTIKGANGSTPDRLHVSSSIADSLREPGSTTMLIADAGNTYLTLGYGFDRIPGGFGAGTVFHQVYPKDRPSRVERERLYELRRHMFGQMGALPCTMKSRRE
jgi:hypothetical protein